MNHHASYRQFPEYMRVAIESLTGFNKTTAAYAYYKAGEFGMLSGCKDAGGYAIAMLQARARDLSATVDE